jgi:hypothetical protein
LPAATGAGRCASKQLHFALGPTTGAAGNEIATVTLTNQSDAACFLGGYAGVELVDSSGNALQDAQRRTGSFSANIRRPTGSTSRPGVRRPLI